MTRSLSLLLLAATLHAAPAMHPAPCTLAEGQLLNAAPPVAAAQADTESWLFYWGSTGGDPELFLARTDPEGLRVAGDTVLTATPSQPGISRYPAKASWNGFATGLAFLDDRLPMPTTLKPEAGTIVVDPDRHDFELYFSVLDARGRPAFRERLVDQVGAGARLDMVWSRYRYNILYVREDILTRDHGLAFAAIDATGEVFSGPHYLFVDQGEDETLDVRLGTTGDELIAIWLEWATGEVDRYRLMSGQLDAFGHLEPGSRPLASNRTGMELGGVAPTGEGLAILWSEDVSPDGPSRIYLSILGPGGRRAVADLLVTVEQEPALSGLAVTGDEAFVAWEGARSGGLSVARVSLGNRAIEDCWEIVPPGPRADAVLLEETRDGVLVAWSQLAPGLHPAPPTELNQVRIGCAVPAARPAD